MKQSKSQVFLFVLLGIALVLGAIWQFYPLPNAEKRFDVVPLKGPDFIGEEIPITPMEKNFFSDIQMLKRLYLINGERFFIYVLDGTNNRHVVHDPTYCFRGGGWEILSKKEISIPGGSGLLFSIEKDGQERTALIWFSNGKEKYGSSLHYFIQTTLRRLTLGYWTEEPVLVVIQPQGEQEVNWDEFFQTFPAILKI